MTMEKYLSLTQTIPQDLVTAFKGFEKFERCLEDRVISGQPMNLEGLTSMLDATAALANYLAQERDKKQSDLLSEQHTFLLGSLQLKILSISTQMRQGAAPELETRFRSLAEELKKSTKDLERKN
jgi:hypothetical protein